MRRAVPLTLALAALLLASGTVLGSPLDERGRRVDVEVTESPREVLVGSAFPLALTLTNRGSETYRATLFVYLYAPASGSRCDEGGSTLRGTIQMASRSVDVAPRTTVQVPAPGDVPFHQRVEHGHVDGPGTYEACVFAVDANSPPPGVTFDSDPFPLKVRVENALPEPKFTWTPRTGNTSTVFRFTAADDPDPDGDALTYRWDFGHMTAKGPANATGREATHQFYPAKSFLVTLTVSDGFGSAQVTEEVVVSRAATPSGDRKLEAPTPAEETPFPGLVAL
ncbi:MAG TPA: PKD domain-containing protein, partial [Candidatus Thermoplasmatota archaeon]|nr:PKD domain-containing protein [Candidatus Thermoplasmatota archaeon]